MSITLKKLREHVRAYEKARNAIRAEFTNGRKEPSRKAKDEFVLRAADLAEYAWWFVTDRDHKSTLRALKKRT